MKKYPILVTQPSLPPLEEFIPYLKQIWGSKVLSNGGPFHQMLEEELCNYLGVPHISLFSNGTIALITALKALDIKGEVITTPYSFAATANSVLWNNLTPVFADINLNSLNLDPAMIEAAITPRTSAIMPVHVYGYPCEVDSIEQIAKKNNLKVIYDAAHSFGVSSHLGSLLNYGDLSVLSFHATKVFNTFEGGAIVCQDQETKRRIDQLKNFGLSTETSLIGAGINGKMNEFSAALGLLQLEYVASAIQKRRNIDILYREELKNIVGIRCHNYPNSWNSNYNYFPIFVEDSYPMSRDQLYEKLKKNYINCRRYFYPLLTEFLVYKKLNSNLAQNFPKAKEASERVICLPIHPELSKDEVKNVTDIINYVQV